MLAEGFHVTDIANTYPVLGDTTEILERQQLIDSASKGFPSCKGNIWWSGDVRPLTSDGGISDVDARLSGDDNPDHEIAEMYLSALNPVQRALVRNEFGFNNPELESNTQANAAELGITHREALTGLLEALSTMSTVRFDL